jgi:hypothetical protein
MVVNNDRVTVVTTVAVVFVFILCAPRIIMYKYVHRPQIIKIIKQERIYYITFLYMETERKKIPDSFARLTYPSISRLL